MFLPAARRGDCPKVADIEPPTSTSDSSQMLSIILPLCERMSLGWSSLQSALAQNARRDSYEIVVVLGGRSAAEAYNDPVAVQLLGQCDSIVEFDGDPAAWDNRVRVYRVGAVRARGEYLFFMEGHTVLAANTASRIAEAFAVRLPIVAVCSPTELASFTPIAQLIDRQKLVDRSNGRPIRFGVGGQSAIRRDTFLELSASTQDFGLFGEVLIDLALREQDVIALDKPFCTHCNDFPPEHWAEFYRHLGRTHYRFFDALLPYSILGKTSRSLLAAARRRWPSIIMAPIAAGAGSVLFKAAGKVGMTAPVLGGLLLRAGGRLLCLAGFTQIAAQKRETVTQRSSLPDATSV